MRILTVASELPPVRSGVARSAGIIAAGAAAAGHDVELRSYRDARVLVRDQLRLSTLGVSLRRRAMRQFDLLHLHGPAPSVSDVLLLRRRLRSVPIPVVYTHHFTVWGEPDWFAPAYRMYDAVATRLAGAADVVVTTTPTYAARVGPHTDRPVEIVPWGVEPPTAPVAPRVSDPATPLRVLVLGQMRRYKGHLVALEALADLDRVRLTLAGRGELADEVSAAAAGHANVEVVLDPADADLEGLYRSHDVILLPATNASEAFGIVLVEGMARGCVPVASELPGVVDVAAPTGLIVAANEPAAIRRAVQELEADRPRLDALAAASIARAATLTWEHTVSAYLDIYAAVHDRARMGAR